ncbi:hypothetical protein O6H91_09G065900 [Diphasiastrum complanatum]|uniref:Uncharacterized protein n=1 Tax=Diphasiastrum complanatum TaxID=34168 RepID=A0ACC2CQ74_DIPCM|nr:hypothetical protein O6H91_09G065900 [Diphasiastrum complanatum]
MASSSSQGGSTSKHTRHRAGDSLCSHSHPFQSQILTDCCSTILTDHPSSTALLAPQKASRRQENALCCLHASQGKQRTSSTTRFWKAFLFQHLAREHLAPTAKVKVVITVKFRLLHSPSNAGSKMDFEFAKIFTYSLGKIAILEPEEQVQSLVCEPAEGSKLQPSIEPQAENRKFLPYMKVSMQALSTVLYLTNIYQQLSATDRSIMEIPSP